MNVNKHIIGATLATSVALAFAATSVPSFASEHQAATGEATHVGAKVKAAENECGKNKCNENKCKKNECKKNIKNKAADM